MSEQTKTVNAFELLKTYFYDFSKGIFSQNPVFIILLGLCPALAVSTSLTSGLAIGLSVLSVLVISNTVISIFRKIIPAKIKLFVHIVIITTLVTIVELLMKKFFPSIAESLGVYLPLLSINCLIIGRAEIFAKKNTFGRSLLDGFGMGLGFLFSIFIISVIRELFGTFDINLNDIGLTPGIFGNEGKITINFFDYNIELLKGMKFFLSPAGGFIILGLITAFFAGIKMSLRKDKK